MSTGLSTTSISPREIPKGVKELELQPRDQVKKTVYLSRIVIGNRQMKPNRFDSAWDAIEESPENTALMKLRSSLMSMLQDYVNSNGFNNIQAARHFNVTIPRASDLMHGKINLFELEDLVNMATAAGLHIELRVLRPN